MLNILRHDFWITCLKCYQKNICRKIGLCNVKICSRNDISRDVEKIKKLTDLGMFLKRGVVDCEVHVN
uniref:Uncharacterized protein n=1 Tax=Rhizophagus irregularis (strain DAOM 181602 / DAOM 197198 / MUCL 43194) TaxID=747089 RepID=U9UZU5_RHIID